MKLQYSAMGSMGTTWIDCQDRFDKFVAQACQHYGHTVEQITEGLERGCKIKTGPLWDNAELRDADSIKPVQRPAETRKQYTCSQCGQTGYAGQYPFSTLPGSGCCDDCC